MPSGSGRPPRRPRSRDRTAQTRTPAASGADGTVRVPVVVAPDIWSAKSEQTNNLTLGPGELPPWQPRPAAPSIGTRQQVREISLGGPPVARASEPVNRNETGDSRDSCSGTSSVPRIFGSERHDKNGETEDRERGGSHANSLISASACSSQKRMSISRYIVVARVRCS